MFKFEGALIEEQGVKFAIVVVKKHILDSSSEAEKTRESFSKYFPGIPIILMAQDSRGIPTYLGRKDIVNFLANINFNRIPWQEFTVS